MLIKKKTIFKWHDDLTLTWIIKEIKLKLQQEFIKNFAKQYWSRECIMQIEVLKLFSLPKNQTLFFHKKLSVRWQLPNIVCQTNLSPQPISFQHLANWPNSIGREHTLLEGTRLKGYSFLNCPCNGGPSMTPNQLRFRASSFKDLSTTNSSDFTPDFWEWILIPKHLPYANSTYPPL